MGDTADIVLAGHLRYVTRVGNRPIAGNYPYIGELVSTFEVQSIEFLAPTTRCTRSARPARSR